MPQGWWYSSPLPGGRRLLALQTDADRPAARFARSGEGLLAAARETPAVAALLVRTGFRAASPARFTAAHGCRLDPAAGEGWLAAGDAALSLDPLAARGIFNALFTGFAGAEAADRHLAGDPDALPGHARLLARLADAYERERAHWYVEEARWPGEPFWARRRGLMAA
jgi:flavin-dependent dehydrogenase